MKNSKSAYFAAAALILSILSLPLLFSCARVPSSPEETAELTTTVTTTAVNTTATTTAADTSAPVPPDDSTVEKYLSGMTLEEKIGQMFYVRCPENAAAAVEKYHLGGLVLFASDFENKSAAEVKADIVAYQAASKIPLLIGVDEEGGTVVRISRCKAFRAYPFRSPRDLYAEGGLELIKSDTAEKMRLLLSLCINVNMAPVCDISLDKNDFMYERSLGEDADATSEYVSAVVKIMCEYKIGSVLKHFPGYGGNADTHTGIAVDERGLDSFEKSDFLPFEAGIRAGAGAVLVSHNIVKCMDETMPASLSEPVHAVLRSHLGYGCVVMTDDLYMDAIKEYTNGEEAAVLAVLAGNDIVCTTDYETQYEAVLDAVRNGRIGMDKIDMSVARILKLKISLGLIAEQ